MARFKLIIDTGRWPTLAQRRENVVRLLRNAADRVERGDDYGGFHFSWGDTQSGGFAFEDVRVDTSDILETGEDWFKNAKIRLPVTERWLSFLWSVGTEKL